MSVVLVPAGPAPNGKRASALVPEREHTESPKALHRFRMIAFCPAADT